MSKFPYEKSFFLSDLFFLWLFKSIRSKDPEILFQIPPNLDSEPALELLKHHWSEELKKPKPSYFFAMLKTIYKDYLISGLIAIIGTVQKTIVAVIIKEIVDYLIDPNGYKYKGALLAIAYICSCLTLSTFKGNSDLRILLLAGKMKAIATQMLSEKVLKLERSQINEGKIFNVLSSDIEMFELMMFTTQIVCTPFMILVTSLVLYYMFDSTGLIGIGLSALHIPIIIIIGGISGKIRNNINVLADQRMGLVANLIEGIKIFKLYAWELSLVNFIKDIRKQEISQKFKLSNITGLLTVIAIGGNVLVIYITFYIHLHSGRTLTIGQIYLAITIYFSNHLNIVYVNTNAILSAFQLRKILTRIGEILMLKESKDHVNAEHSKYSIYFKKATFSYNTELKHEILESEERLKIFENNNKISLNVLEELSFKVSKKTLLMVVGPVGSSKSSLLLALLNELVLCRGSYNINGKISFASETPWIITGSIRENILMDREFNQESYEKVLQACALVKDLQSFDNYDETLIGEKGITLSGGQRVRINLARALYANSDILLLDDPLSSVDAEVSSHIFHECILKQKIEGKTVILVTHQIQYLPQADKILVLNNGTKEFFGNYEELKLQNNILSYCQNELQQIIQDRNSSKISNQQKIFEKIYIEEEITGEKLRFRSLFRYFKIVYRNPVLFFISVVLVAMFQTNFQLTFYWFSHKYTGKDSKDEYLSTLGYLIIASYVTTAAFVLYESNFLVGGHHKLHDHAIESLSKTKMVFFDKNPSGRIINRFSKDVSQCDGPLHFFLLDVTNVSSVIIGSIIATVIIVPYNAIIVPIWIFSQIYLFKKLSPLVMKTRKVETVSRAPILSTFNSVIEGLPTIRCQNLQEKFLKDFKEFIQYNYRAYITFHSFARFAQVYCDLFGLMLVGVNVIIITAAKGEIDIELAAYSLASCLFITGISGVMSKDLIELNINFMSAQRLLEYEDLEQEKLESSAKFSITHGNISFQNISLRYRPELPLSLNDLSFDVNAGEKVGIIGRTGAGKSSIIHVLCRLTDPQSGTIIIDGQDYLNSGLHCLRQQISVIPQLAVLFATSIRENLDPFKKFTERQLNRVLKLVQIKEAIDEYEQGLDLLIGEKGITLSAGQRQLLCLARAVLLKNRIVVLDEATSNVDMETDRLIQKIVNKKFKGCTMLVIAHRLLTAINSDKIVVMGNGRCEEIGDPEDLFNSNGKFCKFAQLAGITLKNIQDSKRK